MKEFVGLFANTSLVESDDETMRGIAELIVLTSEAVYYRDDTMIHYERPSKAGTLRFVTTRDGIKSMIAGLQKVAAELQDLEERVTIAPRLETQETEG